MEDLPIWVMLVIFVMFVLVPLFLLWAGVTVIKSALKFNKGAERVLGTIVSVRKTYISGTGDTDGGYTYFPTYQYEGLDGVKYQGETAASSSRWNYPIGRQDEVMANPNDRTAVRYPGPGHFIMGVALLAFAAVFFGGGVYVVISATFGV